MPTKRSKQTLCHVDTSRNCHLLCCERAIRPKQVAQHLCQAPPCKRCSLTVVRYDGAAWRSSVAPNGDSPCLCARHQPFPKGSTSVSSKVHTATDKHRLVHSSEACSASSMQNSREQAVAPTQKLVQGQRSPAHTKGKWLLRLPRPSATLLHGGQRLAEPM